MKRREAIQTIAMGVSGLGLISQCTLNPPSPPILAEKDQNLLGLLTEAIVPSKSMLNQIEGALTSEELDFYRKGLAIFKGLVEQTFSEPYENLDFNTQNYTIQRALGHPGELGYFMKKNRQWSLRHFMTSERYMTEFFNYEFIPNRHLGCVPVQS
jgi:hypothetical protein